MNDLIKNNYYYNDQIKEVMEKINDYNMKLIRITI